MDRRRVERAARPASVVDDEPPVVLGLDSPDDSPPERPPRPSLDGLPIVGLSRRRAAWSVGAVVVLWIVFVFARQVGDASAATARADRIRTDNATLSNDVDELRSELALIQKQEYIEQQARGYGLGSPRERPFSLAADAPTPAPDAPGSAAARLGAQADRVSPLESWLSILFGPSPGS